MNEADRKLQGNEALFNSLLHAAPHAIIIINADGIIEVVNHRATEFFGYSEDELLGAPLEMLVPESLRNKHVTHRQEYFETPRSRPMGKGYDLVGRRKDGTEFPIAVGLGYTRLNDHLSGIAFITDITERKEFERAFTQSQEQYRTTFEQAAIGIIHTNVDGDFTRVNPHICELLGYTRDEMLQMSVMGLTHPDDRPTTNTARERILQGKATSYTLEKRIRHHDGQWIWVNTTASILRDPDGNEMGFIKVIEDIRERRFLEDELRRLNSDLENRIQERTAHLTALNQELEAFSYSVSHDLRAPLRAVNGFSQALEEDYYDQLDDIGRDFLLRIRRESQRMGQLIDDLISLSRLSRSEMTFQQVNLSKIARTIIENLRQNDDNRDVTVTIQPEMEAWADAALIRVVMENLIGNAWKFTGKRDDPTIEIATTQQDDNIVYYVRDNGAGFDMAYVDKLFGAFQRLHAMTEFEGTGIGLATVQRIIHRHSGIVWAEGAVNQGATFYFTLGEENTWEDTHS